MGNNTIDLRVKFVDCTGTRTLASQYATDSTYLVLEHVQGTGLRFRVVSSGTTIVSMTGTEITDTLWWHHIAVCKVGSDYGLYLDGVQVAHTYANVAFNLSSFPWCIGAFNSTNYFKGYIDECRLQDANDFNASPVADLSDTIVVPTVPYAVAGTEIEAFIPTVGGFIVAFAPVFGSMDASVPTLTGDITALNLEEYSGDIYAYNPASTCAIIATSPSTGPIVASNPTPTGSFSSINFSPIPGNITDSIPTLAGFIDGTNFVPSVGQIEATSPVFAGNLKLSYAFVVTDTPIIDGVIYLRVVPYIKDISGQLPALDGLMYGAGTMEALNPSLEGQIISSTPISSNISSTQPRHIGNLYGAGKIDYSLPCPTGAMQGTVFSRVTLNYYIPALVGNMAGHTNVKTDIVSSNPRLHGVLNSHQDGVCSITGRQPGLIGNVNSREIPTLAIGATTPILAGRISLVAAAEGYLSTKNHVLKGSIFSVSEPDDYILTHIRGAIR